MKILYIASSGAPTGLYGGSVALLNMLKGVSQTENIVVAFPDKGRGAQASDRGRNGKTAQRT